MSHILNTSSSRWNANLTPPWGVTAGISNVISQLELRDFELLPNLHLGSTLVVVSDYSGHHRHTTHVRFHSSS